MGQIMAIDYGKARTGLAVTDDMQIIASALQTVERPKLIEFLKTYFQLNKVEEIVVGLPTDLRGNLSEIETEIQQFLEQFKTEFPQIKINRFDERFTSKMASFFISQSGKSKKERQQKGLIDKVSATLILQNFLETR
ncbi:Holliday junction resolvase RuvX [Elizabethkingia meningoseptica]|uniref:Holliday junction resolvase RuvX n=1 Tax=Elizabethkingia meningoseptica TaxID=238 RepID=UPI00201281A8|nr:Holliday junction resolvase RuvX [Elizabethkingia meningoseptica]MCL1674172.1 Holliday junction resolvase RuvX [Elizabethkingia meningoseptica]MCL1685187.1 Holliday junction resolvase RuvX [Elizabethkingia meningoseptica]